MTITPPNSVRPSTLPAIGRDPAYKSDARHVAKYPGRMLEALDDKKQVDGSQRARRDRLSERVSRSTELQANAATNIAL